MSSPSNTPSDRPVPAGPEVAADPPPVLPALLVFTALRIGLVAVLTGLLLIFVPLIIALAIAIVVQLPLSLLLFGRQRDQLKLALAARNADRRAERRRLRSALRGEG